MWPMVGSIARGRKGKTKWRLVIVSRLVFVFLVIYFKNSFSNRVVYVKMEYNLYYYLVYVILVCFLCRFQKV